MKTVLFIDEKDAEVWQSYLRYDFILNEFCNSGVFSVCLWHTEGRSVHAAVPGLEAALDGAEQWRALIVRDMRNKGISPQVDRHFDNPFDFPENYDWEPGNPAVESSRSIIRLAQMLGGIPEKTSMVWPEETDGHMMNLEDGYGVEYVHPDERYEMLKRYRLGVPRPEQIICVTPHDRDDDFMQARRSDVKEENRGERDSFGFWQRNGYPANMRFVMVERRAKADVAEPALESLIPFMQEEKVRHGRDDWFAFWLSVLTLATSSLDSSQLHAYKLHSMKVNIDEPELDAVFSRRYTEWSAVRDGIAREMAIEDRRLTIDEIGMRDLPDYNAAISVEFDLRGHQSLLADASVVGLIRDIPQNDRATWNGKKRHILEAFTTFVRAPRRALYSAAYRFRSTPDIDPHELESCVLNDCQCAEIDDELLDREIDLARNVGNLAFSFDTYRGRFEEQSTAIHDAISKRSPKKQTVFAVGVALGAFLLGFLPYCLGAFSGFGASVSAFAVTALSCLTFVLVAFVTLKLMQKDLKRAYYAFNDFMMGIVKKMHDEGMRLSKRLTDYATFRRLWSIRARQYKKEAPTERLKKLGRQDAHLQTRVEDIKKVAPDCSIDPMVYGDLMQAGWESMLDKLETESFFSICPVCSARRPFNGGTALESTVDVPYGFISNVELNALDLC